jgi:hypothetical protein
MKIFLHGCRLVIHVHVVVCLMTSQMKHAIVHAYIISHIRRPYILL